MLKKIVIERRKIIDEVNEDICSILRVLKNPKALRILKFIHQENRELRFTEIGRSLYDDDHYSCELSTYLNKLLEVGLIEKKKELLFGTIFNSSYKIQDLGKAVCEFILNLGVQED